MVIFRRNLVNAERTSSYSRFSAIGLLLLCAVSAFAQRSSMSPYQGERDGVSAGGKWTEFLSEDKMTGSKKIRFELLADNYLKEDPNYKPRIELFCTDGN